MPLSFIVFIFFYLFPCTAPIRSALNVKAATLRSAETVFCFSFQPNVPVTGGGFLPSGGLGGSVKLFSKFFHCLCSCEHSHSCFSPENTPLTYCIHYLPHKILIGFTGGRIDCKNFTCVLMATLLCS
jgi:hypothetical protein